MKYFPIFFFFLILSSHSFAYEVPDSVRLKNSDTLNDLKPQIKTPVYKNIAVTVHCGYYKDFFNEGFWDQPAGLQGIPYGFSLEFMSNRFKKHFSVEFSAFFFPGIAFSDGNNGLLNKVFNISYHELTSFSFVFKIAPIGNIGNFRPYFHFGPGGSIMLLAIDLGCGVDYKLKYGFSLNLEGRMIYDLMKGINNYGDSWYPIFFTAGLKYQIE